MVGLKCLHLCYGFVLRRIVDNDDFAVLARQCREALRDAFGGVVGHDDGRAAGHGRKPHYNRRLLTAAHNAFADSHETEVDIIQTSLPGVIVIQPKVHEDPRGFFMETYRAEALAEAGIRDSFVQDNHSRSVRGVLRGLHYQLRQPQAKLCRVVSGEVFDVAVDVRLGSPTFGQWVGVMLSEENKLQIYVPRGFAHGYVVRSASADFLYKCSDYYDASDDRGVLWNDPAIGIAWDVAEPIVSAKDQQYLRLADVPHEMLPRFKS
jgi:dTDP-4-dehydrorhamnose 3,5-epimerase